jgi:fatty-acyl-CoA synthase
MNTGDIGKVDQYGFLKLVDRSADIIKSGGEWISSQDLENLVMAYPKILEAACIGIPHEKWGERPLVWAVPKQDYKGKVTKEELMEFLKSKVQDGTIAQWWLPDDIQFVEAIPRTGTGKFDKKVFRQKVRG